ncbi:MAG: hypothetical protein ACE5FS_08925, partial [Paracoccaceae bacterium]
MPEIEIIADGGRCRCWPAAEKLRIVEETLYGDESISAVARRNGVACSGSLFAEMPDHSQDKHDEATWKHVRLSRPGRPAARAAPACRMAGAALWSGRSS